MPKTIEELAEDLCDYCEWTEYGHTKVNTGPWNLCEGARCEQAYQHYLETATEEDEEDA